MNTSPKERPILFNAEMVRAILDGRKTQTRRVAKVDLSPWLDGQADKIDESEMIFHVGEGHSGFGLYVSSAEYPEEGSDFYRCPFGNPGDRLWVRETWSPDSKNFYPFNRVAYRGDHHSDLIDRDVKECRDHAAHCEAIRKEHKVPEGCMCEFRWRPSIHMPRWASRITLEIKSVRVERLQDISEEDAIREGIKQVGNCSPPNYSKTDKCYFNGLAVGFETAKHAFAHLWDQIYDNWEQNPWVWVIEFERVKS